MSPARPCVADRRVITGQLLAGGTAAAVIEKNRSTERSGALQRGKCATPFGAGFGGSLIVVLTVQIRAYWAGGPAGE
jgi:hypothetical protein